MRDKGYFLKAAINLLLLITLQLFILSFLGTESLNTRLAQYGWVKTLAIPLITLLMGWANVMISPLFKGHDHRYLNVSELPLWTIYVLFHISSFLISWFVLGQLFALLAVWVFAALFLYNWKIRLWPMVGNVIVSIIPALSVVVLRFAFTDIPYLLLMFFALFTFLFQFISSWEKDLYFFENSAHVNSFGSLMGRETRLRVLQIMLVFVLSLFLIFVNVLRKYFFGPMEWVFIIYMGLCIFLPLALLLFKLDNEALIGDRRLLMNRLMYVKIMGVAALMLF